MVEVPRGDLQSGRAPSLRFLVGCLLCVGCELFDQPMVEPAGLIYGSEYLPDTAEVTIPGTADRGETFEVTIHTIGGGCTDQVARTRVAISGSIVEIRPYNETRDALCPSIIIVLTHRVQLTLEQPGPALVRIIGRAVTVPVEGGFLRDREVALEFPVLIQ